MPPLAVGKSCVGRRLLFGLSMWVRKRVRYADRSRLIPTVASLLVGVGLGQVELCVRCSTVVSVVFLWA